MNTVLPIYYQIMQTVKGWILNKEFNPGEKIPSENELAGKFNVSRLTVRQAISRLTQEGLLNSGALPNGRKFGDPLADGGINPQSGYDINGPMAAILSASKIDSKKQKANVFNQKFTPSSIAGESGLRKFQNYIETAMNLGLDMIQFNIVDAETLRAAQEHPEKYADLVVRVSGYNARFVEMTKFVQDTIIERTEHKLM